MRKIILLVFFVGTCISVKAQLFSKGYNEGYYYDNTGTKITGNIKESETYILFKKPKSDIQKKILAADIKSYVIGADSLVVSHNTVFKKPLFLKVLINNPTRLYFYDADEKISLGTPAGTQTGIAVVPGKAHSKYYFYGANPDALNLLTQKNFIDVMSGIMSDKPEIVERIKDETIKLDNIAEWVIFYNQEKAAYPVN